MALVARWVRAFGRFWIEFLFGDSPALFPATLGIVAVAYGLHHDRVAAVVTVPILVIGLVVGTAYLGRSKPNEEDRSTDVRGPD